MESESLRACIAQLVAGKPTQSVGDAFALADAVIAELGLTVETTTEKWIGGGMDLHRYVTKWDNG